MPLCPSITADTWDNYVLAVIHDFEVFVVILYFQITYKKKWDFQDFEMDQTENIRMNTYSMDCLSHHT